MSKKTKPGRGPQTFAGCLRHFLTPELYKQAHQAHRAVADSRPSRWTLHPLLLVLLVTTWCAGDSQPERFETARAFYIALAPGRRRPGQTVQGFQMALARLPMVVLRVFATGLRRHLWARLAPWLGQDGFIPFGCDGSRLACPRVAELERRLGQGSNDAAPPQVWITALVHLSTGLLWSWRIGQATASERDHLRHLVPTLPPGALVVTDAGYQGVDLTRALVAAGVDVLMRVSSQTTLYTADTLPAAWRDGMILYWTTADRRAGRGPLWLRLIRVSSPKCKTDVWLLTNVPATRLSVAAAGRFYQMRWENEGFFRTYKRTLSKVKLSSRSVRLIHREVEGSLLAVQLLLAQGVWARASLVRKGMACSPRQILVAIRREIREVGRGRGRPAYRRRLEEAGREDRPHRASSKAKRVWPTRVPHKPPRPPNLRPLEPKLIAKLHKLLGVV